MARDEPLPAIAAALATPRISLLGEVDEQMVDKFLGMLRELDGDAGDGAGDLAIEVTTLGGDAEMARRIVLEIDALRARRRGRVVFLGKTIVYSAGTTIMSAFPCADRYLTSDTMLMIHCRQLQKRIELDGPMRGSLPKVEALCSQIKTGITIEEENFRRLVEGCDVDVDTLIEKALYNWYLTAEEALKLRLVAAVFDILELQWGRADPREGTK